ncbi:Protein farnesyltransferase/geranylgeranyltransferase type-1 subunit alpha [Pseudocercospora fuligena]|uniref:Protein farnesyltransferase/geranylgeranyltransferase type-1 subunit alpha n=1 Tax=Pseudocercospora fuligena TaxID=685502 RepID=A0A8H6RPI4_9PEZI|nr:Protein farnesyltransferase/geranylgeranyltransferase type-1 subunit alpha [Pseudocercospora fuligena]
MGKYSTSPQWADITPLPTNEGGPNPLAAIAYSDEYAETMSYLRACMAADEASPRVLDLTEDLIDMNPAHYTVWLYRAKVLIKVSEERGDLLGGLKGELEWLNEIALSHQKNYQIWHHRNMLVDKIKEVGGEGAVDVRAEQEFVERMFGLDAKNYHVWSYRQWLVKRFNLWDESKFGELEFTERMLKKDVRNNSAWNHRWYVINGNPSGGGVEQDEGVRDREVAFAKKAIEKAPQNCSPWNYLRGVVRKSGVGLGSLKGFAEQYANLEIEVEGGVRSSHALDLLADILGEEEGEGGKVKAGPARILSSCQVSI